MALARPTLPSFEFLEMFCTSVHGLLRRSILGLHAHVRVPLFLLPLVSARTLHGFIKCTVPSSSFLPVCLHVQIHAPGVCNLEIRLLHVACNTAEGTETAEFEALNGAGTKSGSRRPREATCGLMKAPSPDKVTRFF